MIKDIAYYAYIYDVIEHESGWGTRHDGYVCFHCEKMGQAWVEIQCEGRTIDKVPDCYDTYENGRWVEVTKQFHNTLISRSYYWTTNVPKIETK